MHDTARDVTRHTQVFVIVPAYNEATVIGATVAEICALGFRVIVVDDASSDDTSSAAANAGAIVVRHVLNRGQGAAIQTGLEFALNRGARWVATFDADGQHVPTDLAPLLAPLIDGGCDVSLGSRFLDARNTIPLLRRAVLRAAVVFTRLVSRIAVTDAHNGLRAFTREAAARIRIRQDRMAHASEIIDEIRRRKLRWTEVPVEVRYTDYSRRKGQHNSALFRILIEYFIGRWTA